MGGVPIVDVNTKGRRHKYKQQRKKQANSANANWFKPGKNKQNNWLYEMRKKNTNKSCNNSKSKVDHTMIPTSKLQHPKKAAAAVASRKSRK